MDGCGDAFFPSVTCTLFLLHGRMESFLPQGREAKETEMEAPPKKNSESFLGGVCCASFFSRGREAFLFQGKHVIPISVERGRKGDKH